MKIRFKLIFILLVLLLFSCKRNEMFFDFSEYVQAGLANHSNKKLLIYINLHNDTTGLDFSCNMGIPYKLNPYIESKNHDVLFLIDLTEDKFALIEERLVDWCFNKNYLITHSTPNIFKPARSQGVKWVAFLFDKNGIYIETTNPSMANFKDLMGPISD